MSNSTLDHQHCAKCEFGILQILIVVDLIADQFFETNDMALVRFQVKLDE